MQLGRREGWSWAAALATGLSLRALFVGAHPRFVGDTLIYGDLAHNMLAHHVYGLTEDRIRPTLIRLPGYPLFLALCFALFGTANYLAVVWVQVFVDLLGCALLGMLARRVFGPRVGSVCVWIAALCPFTANYAAAALTETLSLFCVVLGFWALEQWREAPRRLGSAALVGAALSGAVLLRPDGVLLAGAVLPGMAWVAWRSSSGSQQQVPCGNDNQKDNGRGNRNTQSHGRGNRTTQSNSHLPWWGALLACGLLVTCLGGWALRNWRVYHVVQPLAPKYANDPGEPAPLGFARWYRTWGVGLGDTARVYWAYDGSTLSMEDLPSWAFDSPAQRARTAALIDRYNAESSSTPAIEEAFAQLAAERVRAHPLRFYVGLPLARLGDMWLRPRTELFGRHMPLDWWDARTRPKAALLGWAYGALNVALLGCAAWGWGRWWRAGWNRYGVLAAAMVGFVVLRSVLLMTIDNSEPRYVLECYPVVILLAALALGGGRGRLLDDGTV